MGALQKDLASFERLGAQVLGVSPDDLESHRKFAEKLGLTFPLVSDPGGTIAAQYGTGRMTFVIDKAGLIRFVKSGMPDTAELLKALEDLGK